MNAISIAVLAVSMSMDAFAAALGKGAALHRPRMLEAMRTGLIFGIIEAMTPIVGWMIGTAALRWVAPIDHWLAFGILGLLGLRMIVVAERDGGGVPSPRRHSFRVLAVTAIATSVDALAVGTTLGLVEVDIAVVAAAIGVVTFVMAATGTMAGRWLGPRFGRGAECLGGLCLLAVGTRILIEHLFPA